MHGMLAKERRKMGSTYKIIPEWYSTLGSMTTPFSLMGLDILKVERTEATMIHSKEFAMCAPGQILSVKRSQSRNTKERS